MEDINDHVDKCFDTCAFGPDNRASSCDEEDIREQHRATKGKAATIDIKFRNIKKMLRRQNISNIALQESEISRSRFRLIALVFGKIFWHSFYFSGICFT